VQLKISLLFIIM